MTQGATFTLRHRIQGQLLIADLRFIHPDHAFAQLNIRAATCHIRCNCHRTRLTRQGHDFSFLRVVLRVQHVVRNPCHTQHTAQDFRRIDRHGTQEHRLTAIMGSAHFIDDGAILFTLGLVNQVIAIHTTHGAVGRNRHHVQVVDVIKFSGFGFCRTGHTGQLRVEAEVVLNRNGGQGLRFAFDIHAFLRFHRLMQAFAPTATGQDTTGEFIHDHHLVILHHILFIAVVQRIGAQQLVHDVQAFALGRKAFLDFTTTGRTFLCAQAGFAIQCRQLSRQIGHHIHLRIIRRNKGGALIGQGDFTRLFINRKEQDFLEFTGFTLAHIGEHHAFNLFVQTTHCGLFNQVLELFILRRAVINLIQTAHRHFVIALRDKLLCIGKQLRANAGLFAEDAFHARLLSHIFTRGRALRRTRDNQRRTRFVNQDTVHFVHDCKGVTALHHLRGVGRHAIIAKVVKTEFAVRTVGDIASILCATFCRAHRVLNAAHRQTEIGEQMPHELRVTTCQIIVYRHQVCRLTRQGIQVQREGRHQGLTFTRLHFGNLTLVQHDTADNLHIKGNHIPGQLMTADHARCSHQTAARILHRCERFGQNRIQRFPLSQARLEFHRLLLQFLLRKALILFFQRIDLMHQRHNPLDITLILGSEK